MSGDKGCLIPARRGIQRLTSVGSWFKTGPGIALSCAGFKKTYLIVEENSGTFTHLNAYTFILLIVVSSI